MRVSAARSDDFVSIRSTVQLVPVATPGVLIHEVPLAADVHVTVDLMAPDRWQAASQSAAVTAAAPQARAVVGDEVRDRLPRPPVAQLPWLRVALVDALDRWLQAPLEQCLVDAERGVTRGRAARSLPLGSARAMIVGDALRLARRASHDLTRLLRRLGRHPRPLPAALTHVLKNLVDGYTELLDEVSGPDRELAAVVDGWRRLSGRAPSGRLTTSLPRPAAPHLVRPSPRLGNVIDPRQVRARVLALSTEPASPDVAVEPAPGGRDSLLVRVAAFRPPADRDAASRLLVRLVDRRSGEAATHALLRPQADGTGFEAEVPLCGMEVEQVRADVVDAVSGLPPAADDADDALQEARRAVVFLAEWRRMVGLAQLQVPQAAPACRLRDLAARLQPCGAPAARPLFAGGPSRAELDALADLGDDEFGRRLRGGAPIGMGLRVLTAGAAALLVAEVAALVGPPS